jgi:hypothetical protein
MPWTTIAKVAFSILITAIGKIPPEQWAKLGTLLTNFLQNLSNNLPAGHPAFSIFNAYKAPLSKLPPVKKPDLWEN